MISEIAGTEWIIDAQGCLPERLSDEALLRGLCQQIVRDLGLTVLGQPQWHCFPPQNGITGLTMLSESHLACHTYPELGLATFNLYCCREREAWPWEARLEESLGAQLVIVRRVVRGAADLYPLPSAHVAQQEAPR
ncbi:MAG: S-adenosylmethionine decarboxylase [Planctomycetia bacterium]|nr:S-adenosylmethionine decarboxylase [Planctomycetia bacterium]